MSSSPRRRRIIAGNWKHQPLRAGGLELATHLARQVETSGRSDVEVVVFPPAPFLGALVPVGFRLGAQDLDPVPVGAHTGALGAELLGSFDVTSVLVGHSERRNEFGDTDAVCRTKFDAALDHGLEPYLCVGETLDERESEKTFEVVERQLDLGLAGVGEAELASIRSGERSVVIAYEPIWAIGTGRTATPEQAVEVHQRIRTWLVERWGADVGASVPILYGGSVKPANAADLLASDVIDGALVGGASLDAASFMGIVTAVPRSQS